MSVFLKVSVSQDERWQPSVADARLLTSYPLRVSIPCGAVIGGIMKSEATASHSASEAHHVLRRLQKDLDQRRDQLKQVPDDLRRTIFKAFVDRRTNQRKAQLALAEQGRSLRADSSLDLSSAGNLVESYLRERANGRSKVLRPTSRVHRYPEPNSSDEPVKTRVGVNPDDIYWHPFLAMEGNDDHLLQGGVVAAFGVPLGALVGSLVAAYPIDESLSHDWWFGEDAAGIVSESGIYEATTIALAWGKYGLHAGGLLEEAEVKIEAYWQNPTWGSSTGGQVLFSRSGTDITEQNTFVGSAEIKGIFELSTGSNPSLIATVKLTAHAVREGSNAVLNMYPGVGGVAILGCTLERIN